MSTWTKNKKLSGIREKQPGAKGLLRKKWMMNSFFSKIRGNKEKQVLLGLRSNLIEPVYIFLTHRLLMNFNGIGYKVWKDLKIPASSSSTQ